LVLAAGVDVRVDLAPDDRGGLRAGRAHRDELRAQLAGDLRHQLGGAAAADGQPDRPVRSWWRLRWVVRRQRDLLGRQADGTGDQAAFPECDVDGPVRTARLAVLPG